MIVYTAQKILLFLSVFAVAPHAGSVDRNDPNTLRVGQKLKSLPTRGAWIEIVPLPGVTVAVPAVAPHAGSVDRNIRCR